MDSEYQIGRDKALALVRPGEVQNLAVQENSGGRHHAAAKRLIHGATTNKNNTKLFKLSQEFECVNNSTV